METKNNNYCVRWEDVKDQYNLETMRIYNLGEEPTCNGLGTILTMIAQQYPKIKVRICTVYKVEEKKELYLVQDKDTKEYVAFIVNEESTDATSDEDTAG